VLIIVLIGAAAALALMFFKVNVITVTGDEIYNNEDIIAASQIEIGDNMFLTNKKKTAENIENLLPYIEKADIKRNVSGTLTIKITAAVPKMALDNGESFTLISDKGKVLEDGLVNVGDGIIILDSSTVVSAVPGDFLEFKDQTDLDIIKELMENLDSNGITGISSIDVSNHSNVKLVYRERITVLLGQSSTIKDKMDFVRATLARLEEDDPDYEGSIDFTIDKKAYLSPKREDNTTVPFISP